MVERESVTLTRRRLLGGLVALGSASGAAGAGTMAAFSDAASSSGNDVVAGTLNLTLDGADQTVTSLDASDVQPDASGSGSVTLGNTGSLDGDIEVEIAAIRSNENGFHGAENGNADSTPNDGELDEYLEVEATVGSTTVWPRQTVASLLVGDAVAPGVTLGTGDSETFALEWWLPGSTGNDAQSDGVELDLTFRLVQTAP